MYIPQHASRLSMAHMLSHEILQHPSAAHPRGMSASSKSAAARHVLGSMVHHSFMKVKPTDGTDPVW